MADTGGGRYSVYWWDGATDTSKLLKDLPTYKEDGDELKPEAILPLSQTSAGLRVLIMLDGAKEVVLAQSRSPNLKPVGAPRRRYAPTEPAAL
jgi:hypothetical protein